MFVRLQASLFLLERGRIASGLQQFADASDAEEEELAPAPVPSGLQKTFSFSGTATAVTAAQKLKNKSKAAAAQQPVGIGLAKYLLQQQQREAVAAAQQGGAGGTDQEWVGPVLRIQNVVEFRGRLMIDAQGEEVKMILKYVVYLQLLLSCLSLVLLLHN